MLANLKADIFSGKCSIYSQWLNVISLPMLVIAFVLALTPFAFSLFNAISCAAAFFLLVALEWPAGWTPLMMRPLQSIVSKPGSKAIGGVAVTGVLVIGTVGVGGVSGKALGGAALCVAIATILNVIAVVRKEDANERYSTCIFMRV
jgi:hypothetical protein